MSEVGLNIIFDGKYNVVMGDGDAIEYPIGGVACEYARLHPHELKKYIMKNPYFDKTDLKKYGAEALMDFYNIMKKEYGMVTAMMVVADFSNCFSEYGRLKKQELDEVTVTWNEEKDTDAIKSFILKDSGYTEYGTSSIGQAMLTAYSTFAYYYVAFRHIFAILVADGSDEKAAVEEFWMMYAEYIDFQHIDFKIINYDKGFHSLYTIQSSLSLILFEAAHALETGTKFVKCKNCGQYFVPIGRSDSVYCSYPSPQDQKKACRDVGANITRAKKLKNDVLTQEYRRLYMRLKMALKRHPENEEIEHKLYELTNGMKVRRKQREEGSLSTDSILEWLISFDNAQNEN